MFLIDTNVWLELLLDQEKAGEVRRFFRENDASTLFISEFSLYSIGIILSKLDRDNTFKDFLTDTIEDSGVSRIMLDIEDLKKFPALRQRFHLDFDDAYQYIAADKHDLIIVSFDGDFDGTEKGRKAPAEIS